MKLLQKVKENGFFGTLFFIKNEVSKRCRGQLYAYTLGSAGANMKIDSNARLYGCKLISIGNHFVAGQGLRLQVIQREGELLSEPILRIGNNVNFNDHVHIGCVEKVVIGDNVLFASKVFVTDHSHGEYKTASPLLWQIAPIDRELISSPVIIEDNVWVGENVVIMPGVTIGEGAIIGANSFVNENVPKRSIVAGSPARFIKNY